MTRIGRLAGQIMSGDFIVTAEFMPAAETDGSHIQAAVKYLKEVPTAVNISDNPYGVSMSGFAASVHLIREGIEPVLQVVTRDRNRIAIQSDILGASSHGILNLLCLSGYHQALTDNPESANVYDIDSTQMLAVVKKMKESGELVNGIKFSGSLSMTSGAAANPFLRPLELNLLRLAQKVSAGAEFLQTHAVFDTDMFSDWFNAAKNEGITDKCAVIAGVLPLESADEAEKLSAKYTDFHIPAAVIERLKASGNADSQKKEGLAICAEIIGKMKNIPGLRGIHLFSGGKEHLIPEILTSSGLSGKR